MANPSRQGYNHTYRKARNAILGPSGNGDLPVDPPCHWCGAVATTADHEPPLHITGHRHLNLVPACQRCNYGRANRKSSKPSRSW